jgi:hypothetical protein
VGLAAGPRFGFADSASGEVAAGLEGATRLDGRYRLSASVEALGAWAAAHGTPGYVAGEYRVSLVGGRFFLCPAGLQRGALELRACGVLELGALTAASSGVPGAVSRTDLSLSVGGGVGAALRVAPAVAIGLDGGVLDDVHRHSFLVSGTPLFVQPKASGSIDFRVWVTIP